jgi:hypothetical protein
MYWPPNAQVRDDVDTFVLALSALGYTPCDRHDYEVGYQKVAIYASSGRCVLHMARQKFWGGGWLSKLGDMEDIAHPDLRCIEGDPSQIPVALGLSYGRVEQILKRTWWAAFINLGLSRCLWAATKFFFYRVLHPSWIWRNVKRHYEQGKN